LIRTCRSAALSFAKMRWRVERDYEDLKQEIGLWHDEGRGWPGFPSPRYTGNRSLRFPDLRKGEDSPPQDHIPPLQSKNLPFPLVIDPEAPPIRPQRHVPNSITTIRRELAAAIANRLQRYPHCVRRIRSSQRRNL
jgi:hypothetical protein